jgi:hypothetical protein
MSAVRTEVVLFAGTLSLAVILAFVAYNEGRKFQRFKNMRREQRQRQREDKKIIIVPPPRFPYRLPFPRRH